MNFHNQQIYMSWIKQASIKVLNNTAQPITKEFHMYVCSLLVYAPSQVSFFVCHTSSHDVDGFCGEK